MQYARVTLRSAVCPQQQQFAAQVHHRQCSRHIWRRASGGGSGSGSGEEAAPPSGSSGEVAQQAASAVPADELPAELQDLCISEDGQHLIDSKTGKVVNEFGATRFDVAVRAMRGEFDPPAFMENTERSAGLLLDSLTQFPAIYDFQLVVKQQAQQAQAQQEGQQQQQAAQQQLAQPDSPQALLQRYRQLVADTTAADIPLESCTVKERLGGKYVSLCIPARVPAAAVIDLVFAALADDPAVIMKF